MLRALKETVANSRLWPVLVASSSKMGGRPRLSGFRLARPPRELLGGGGDEAGEDAALVSGISDLLNDHPDLDSKR